MPLRLSLLFAALLVLAACGGASDPVAVPEGWVREGTRFWKADADTTGLFRDLETLEGMGVSVEGDSRRAYVERNLKRRLLVVYRYEPEAVDSLFEVHVQPLIDAADLGGPLGSVVDELERPARKAITDRFSIPRSMRDVTTETDYVFPDSLQARIAGARVRMQVALDANGDPVAIELLEPGNPTLDLIGVRSASQQHWQPHYLYVGREFVKIPGWVRYNIVFGDPSAVPVEDAAPGGEAAVDEES